jgi:hypothetical protein
MKVARYEVPGSHKKQVPSRRERYDRLTGHSFSLGGEYIGQLSSYRPYGTGRLFAQIPGNKLPGYLHLVPPGQRYLIPVREIDATSERLSRTRTTTRTRTMVTVCRAVGLAKAGERRETLN